MKFGLIANIHKELFWKELPVLLSWFKENNLPLVLSDQIYTNPKYSHTGFPFVVESQLPENCDMILAVGGDGTILQSAQIVCAKETPILGINLGGLGFLTEIPFENFGREFNKILNGEYRIEKRLMLKGEIDKDLQPLYALNEFVIDKGKSVRVIQIQTQVDGRLLNSYVSDGLIISTPTGSTGYSLASGGPIIAPDTKALIINPICPHSLTNRPVIIPDSSVITITVRTEYSEFVIGADGRDVRYCKTRTKLSIEKAPFSAHLVKPLTSDFLDLLHQKLNWGEDFRDKKRWSHNS